jgi:hypothetical protein
MGATSGRDFLAVRAGADFTRGEASVDLTLAAGAAVNVLADFSAAGFCALPAASSFSSSWRDNLEYPRKPRDRARARNSLRVLVGMVLTFMSKKPPTRYSLASMADYVTSFHSIPEM